MNEFSKTPLPKRKKWALGLAVSIFIAIVSHLVFFAEFKGMPVAESDSVTVTHGTPVVIQNHENNINIEKQLVINGADVVHLPHDVAALDDGYGPAKQALHEARKVNTIAAYESYLSAYPKSPWKHKAEYYRDKLEAEALREEDSIAAYNAYLKKRPDSDWFNHVRHFRDRAEYRQAKKQDSSAAMQQFIDTYPRSDYRKKAEDVIRRLKKLDK